MTKAFIATQLMSGISCTYRHNNRPCGCKNGQQLAGETITVTACFYLQGGQLMNKGFICSKCRKLVQEPAKYSFPPLATLAPLLEKYSGGTQNAADKQAEAAVVEIPDTFAAKYLELVDSYALDPVIFDRARRRAFPKEGRFLDELAKIPEGLTALKQRKMAMQAGTGVQQRGRNRRPSRANRAPEVAKPTSEQFGTQLADALTTAKPPTPAS